MGDEKIDNSGSQKAKGRSLTDLLMEAQDKAEQEPSKANEHMIDILKQVKEAEDFVSVLQFVFSNGLKFFKKSANSVSGKSFLNWPVDHEIITTIVESATQAENQALFELIWHLSDIKQIEVVDLMRIFKRDFNKEMNTHEEYLERWLMAKKPKGGKEQKFWPFGHSGHEDDLLAADSQLEVRLPGTNSRVWSSQQDAEASFFSSRPAQLTGQKRRRGDHCLKQPVPKQLLVAAILNEDDDLGLGVNFTA